MAPHELHADGTRYYSQGDESAFFVWLRSIPCVGTFGGKGERLTISLTRAPDDNELRELIALFFRYGIDMRQLASLVTPINEQWFRNPQGFWFLRVFG